MDQHLLTPKEVAALLNISVRTVYDHFRELGGFYPAGICVLRFDPDELHDILDQSKTRIKAISVRVQDRHSSNRFRKGNPAVRMEEDRHGLFATTKSTSKRMSKTDPNRHGL